MVDFFSHAVFRAAIADIETLGVRVSMQETPGAHPYAVIGGRSNARWWLIPLESGRVAASGLALFQPLLTGARQMKMLATGLSRLGLHRLWARQRVFVDGKPALGRFFERGEATSFAYFTGTDSPHRKVAVQVMDERGLLKGFAKVSRNPQVGALLAHEAGTLDYLQGLDLRTAYTPKVLFFAQQEESSLLVTDTLKTSRTASTTEFTLAHRAFVEELAQKTAPPQPVRLGDLANSYRVRFSRIQSNLEGRWVRRLDDAICALESEPGLELRACFSHGDFTPWNSFLSNGRLYVFDWEYAEQTLPSSNDIIHFLLNEARTRSQAPSLKMEAIMSSLMQPWTGIQQEAAPALVMIYLLTQSLRQIERLPGTMQDRKTWDGEIESAVMFDNLLSKRATAYR
jgi:thiamine kinase-like enzyme